MTDKEKASIRSEVENWPIIEFKARFTENLQMADMLGDFTSMVDLANKINQLDAIIDYFVKIDIAIAEEEEGE